MAFIERIVTDVKFDAPGAAVAGHLIGIRPTEFDGKRNLQYLVKTKVGISRFFGTSELNSKINTSDIGAAILVKFKAERDLGGDRRHKEFQVMFDLDDRLTGSAPAPVQTLEITDDDLPF